MAEIIGPDFVALHVRDLQASTKFYVDQVGLGISPETRAGITVFSTKPIALAVRQARVNLDAVSHLAWGVEVWLKCDDADQMATRLAAAGVNITAQLTEGVVGRQFSFKDPDGYIITVHDGG